MNIWPKQSEADGFYGNPRGRGNQASPTWEKQNLVRLKPPFAMRFSGKPVTSFKIHRKCAESLGRVFDAIWKSAGQDQSQIDAWGVSTFGGSYNFRLMRGSNHLSMHSYGCAIDLSPERFPMGKSDACFCEEVLQAFKDEGWINLAHDRMHFQAALI